MIYSKLTKNENIQRCTKHLTYPCNLNISCFIQRIRSFFPFFILGMVEGYFTSTTLQDTYYKLSIKSQTRINISKDNMTMISGMFLNCAIDTDLSVILMCT